MKKKKLVPKRRFKEFQNTDAWEQCKLGEVVQRVCVGFVGTLKKYYTDSTGIPLYRTGNLNGLKLNTNDLKYVTKQFHLNNAKSQLKYGDILIARHGENGKAVVYESYKEANCLNIVIIRPNMDTSNSIFLANYINSPVPNQQIKNLSAGSTQVVINTKEIEKLTLYFPLKKEEQERIGSFFVNLDHLITLHQRKLEKTKALKSAYLAEMFPAEGKRVPKRRFAGFTEEWEEWKVSDIGNNYYGGGTPKTKLGDYWDGEIPWVQSSDLEKDLLFLNKIKNKITNAGLENSATKLIPPNSIAIVTRVGVGKLSLVPHSYTTSQDFFSIGNLNVNPIFGVYVLYKLLQKEKEMVQGTSIKGITKEDLLTKNILISNSLEEQKKIGELFKRLDDTIANLEQKLKKLKAMKQAYLQEMFV